MKKLKLLTILTFALSQVSLLQAQGLKSQMEVPLFDHPTNPTLSKAISDLQWGVRDCAFNTTTQVFNCEFEMRAVRPSSIETLLKITNSGQLNVLSINSNKYQLNSSIGIGSPYEHGTKADHTIRNIAINYLADGKSNIELTQHTDVYDLTTNPAQNISTGKFRNLNLTPELIKMGYIPEVVQSAPQSPGSEIQISPEKINMVKFVWATGGSGQDVDKFETSVEAEGISTPKVTTKVWEAAPDYVFEPDYNLKSLEEIESFIKKNKHLPEIPSAKVIEKDGIDLASMNMKLLKKIEELTLHTIALNKEIKSLKNKNQ